MLRIEEIDDQGRLTEYREAWRALVDRTQGADIFQTYEWVTAWLGCFWAGRGIRFLFVWDDDELVAVAPLVDDREAAVSCRGSLTLPVNAHTRRMDILSSREGPEVLETMLAHVRSSCRAVRLTLPQSREDSPMLRALPEAARRLKLRDLRRESRRCPIVRIDTTWEAYLASRPVQVQRELKRKSRKIERDWTATWITASTPEQCAVALPDVWDIERNSWKEREGTSLASEQDAVRVYQEFAPGFARAGWLRLYVLYLDGVPAAHILGAEFHGEYFALKTSYALRFRQASPGQALFFYALQDAFARKLKAFDFLGDESRWKNELANDWRGHVNVCVHARFDVQCGWHTLMETQLKPLVRTMTSGLRPALRPASVPSSPASSLRGSGEAAARCSRL